MNFKAKLLFIVLLGVILRFSLRFSSYYGEIAKRVEVSSPVNSWRRVVEGVTLKQLNISPYSGDTFHESPIFLSFYQFLISYLNEFQIACFFILVDIATAFVLSKVCSSQIQSIYLVEKQRIQIELVGNKKDIPNLKDEVYSNLLIHPDSMSTSSFWTIAIYLLSPYSMLSCVGQTTSVISNFLIALTLLTATNGYRISLLFLALLSLNSFYPLILLPAIVLFLEQKYRLNQISSSKKSSSNNRNHLYIDIKASSTQFSIVVSLFIFAFLYGSLFISSFFIENRSFQFIQSTYVFMWSVSDLTPNIGLFWYFFTEMFDHFRDFFLWVFQINFFIYIIPLTVNFWRNPYFISMISLIIHSLFKPYPTVSDFALYLALLPQWSHLFENMKSSLVISCTIVTCSVLAPILWYLWIILGTANSNFYFGITLAYNVAQIFLTTDLMFSYVKREFFINNLQLYKLCKKADKAPKIELSF